MGAYGSSDQPHGVLESSTRKTLNAKEGGETEIGRAGGSLRRSGARFAATHTARHPLSGRGDVCGRYCRALSSQLADDQPTFEDSELLRATGTGETWAGPDVPNQPRETRTSK